MADQISTKRLAAQHLQGGGAKTPKKLIEAMGAIQAQDFAMVKWAVGVRLKNVSEASVEAALNNGDILRTHLLRPTWHLVSSDDIYWMLQLTAPNIRSAMRSRHKQLGLTDDVVKKTNRMIAAMVDRQEEVSRDAFVNEFKAAGIDLTNNRPAHLLLLAELEGIICSGQCYSGKQTYTALDRKVPEKKTLPKDEALAKLATQYFTTRAPVTLEDFTWWSGLPAADARRALQAVERNFVKETVGRKNYWLPASFSQPAKDGSAVLLLPAFDEFIISYKDRSAILDEQNHNQVISKNGIFWPTIIINGKAAGTWKRTIKKNKVLVEARFFQPVDDAVKNKVKEKAEEFAIFLDKNIEISNL